MKGSDATRVTIAEKGGNLNKLLKRRSPNDRSPLMSARYSSKKSNNLGD